MRTVAEFTKVALQYIWSILEFQLSLIYRNTIYFEYDDPLWHDLWRL